MGSRLISVGTLLVSTAPPSTDQNGDVPLRHEENEEEDEDIARCAAQKKVLEEYANVAHRRSIGSPDVSDGSGSGRFQPMTMMSRMGTLPATTGSPE
jgi:hypothetical protein